jgi:hypothetical protein
MGNLNEEPDTGRAINSNDCNHKNQDDARIFFIPNQE